MKVEIPGKLYIAGEYGVVHGAHAIIAPSCRTMRFTIKAYDSPMIHSMKFNQTFDLMNDNKMPRPLINAYTIVLKYLSSLNIENQGFYLTIDSQLDNGDNKLGLGSSATTTVGIIKTVLQFHGVVLTKTQLYKLAVLSDIKDSKITSYGDVALCAYGSWLLYKKFDLTWVKRRLKMPVNQLIDTPWKGLVLKPFKTPAPYIIVINTMQRANSKALVAQFNRMIPLTTRTKTIQSLNAKTLAFYNVLKTNKESVCAHVLALDSVYRALAHTYNLDFYTDAMTPIETLIKDHQGCMKFSGAGGGDNVIGFFKDGVTMQAAYDALVSQGYNIVDVLRRGNDE